MPSCSASDRNFSTWHSSAPPSTTRIHTRPPAPSCLARSTSLSTCARDIPPSPGQPDPLHRVGLEGTELGGGEHLAEVDELEAEAHVGLVGAVAFLGLVPGHPRHRAGTRPGDGLGGVEHGLSDHAHDVVGVGEAHLRVELHELELAVGAQVLVAQTAGDLVVAVERRRP